MAAVYPDARNPFAHPELLEEGFEPWAVGEMYLAAAGGTDVVIDITDTFERKIDALEVPREPASGSRRPRRAHPRPGTRPTPLGGLPEGRLAESYLRVDTQ